MSNEHTNSSVVAARARAIEAAQRLALPSSRGELACESVSRDEALQGRALAPESERSSHTVPVVLDERDSNSGKRKQRTASHSRSMARCSWAFLPRCDVPRRWRAETGDRGTPVPTGNRRERRARARRRQVAQGRGPQRQLGAPCAADYGQQSHVNALGGSGGLPPATVHTCKHFDRAQETCGELSAECGGSNPARRPVYPRQRWNVWAWRRRVAKELDALVAAMPVASKRGVGLSHRARKLRSCGTVVQVRECVCGNGRAGSARYAHPSNDETGAQSIPTPCESRSCWLCQRRRATPLREWLATQVRTLPLPEGFAWSFLTVSPQYAPDDREELSPKGLRARLDALRAAVRAIIREGRDAIHGAFVAFELAGTGHVHAHVMMAARYLDCDWIDRTAARAGGREVHIAIERAHESTAAEVAKYVAKLISPLDEAALTGGETREMIDPALCAAWEVATYGARMHERFGALRKAPMLDTGAPPKPDDGQECCHACGTIGAWRWGFRATRAWVMECHARGLPAFEASMQLARRTREATPLWEQCFNGATRNPIPTRARSRRAR